tara:strand:- start:1570 stop:2163 length:594 start_codon:yes stop_codon:yes gene_type:complete
MGLETIVSELDFLSRKKSDKNPKKGNGFARSYSGIREDEYELVLIDRGFQYKMPFVLNNEILNTVKNVYQPGFTDKKNAKNIFDWVVRNIGYGKRKRGGQGYRNSLEVFNDGEGVCGEMSSLYLVMVRSVGIRGSYVDVKRDNRGMSVNHACAMIDVPGRNGGLTLVDPAYREYDVHHQKYEPLTDFEIYQSYKDWT